MTTRKIMAVFALLMTGCARQMPYTLAEWIQLNGGYSSGEFAVVETVTLRGHPTYLVSYPTGMHGSCGEAIRYRDGVPTAIFSRFCNTPTAGFDFDGDTPVFSCEQSTYEPDYATGSRYEERYRWDGRRFVLASQSSQEHSTVSGHNVQ